LEHCALKMNAIILNMNHTPDTLHAQE